MLIYFVRLPVFLGGVETSGMIKRIPGFAFTTGEQHQGSADFLILGYFFFFPIPPADWVGSSKITLIPEAHHTSTLKIRVVCLSS